MLSVVRKVQPTAGDLHVNRPLTNLSVAFTQGADAFVTDKVFPVVPSGARGDEYYLYDRDLWFKAQAERRAPGSESAGSGWTVSRNTFFCDVWAVHKDVDDHTRSNADPAVSNLDGDATEWVTQQLLLRRDLEWQTAYFATGVWTGSSGSTDITGVAAAPAANQVLQWNDVASTPIQDVDDSRLSIAERTGLMPNVLVLGPRVFAQLKNHPDILDRIKYTERGMITTDLMAGLFEVDRVLVPRVTQNTAAEGATAAYSFVHGRNALLAYAAPSPGLMQPSAGYTFAWTGLLGAGAEGQRIKRFRLEREGSDRIEGEMAFDMNVVAADLAVFFSSIVAA